MTNTHFIREPAAIHSTMEIAHEHLIKEALRCVETLEAFVKNHREILDAKI